MPFLALLFSKFSIKDIITYFLAITCLASTGFTGYHIGAHRAKVAEEALRVLKVSYEDATKAYNRTTAELSAQVAELQTKYAQDTYKLKDDFKKYESDWANNLAKKDAVIKQLRVRQTENQSNLDVLTKKLANSTDSNEKLSLVREIQRLKDEMQKIQDRAQGLECLSVPIPEEYVETLNGIKEAQDGI